MDLFANVLFWVGLLIAGFSLCALLLDARMSQREMKNFERLVPIGTVMLLVGIYLHS